MSTSVIEKIALIKSKADLEIHALREEARIELEEKLSAARAVLRDLQEQYEALTGRNLRGEIVKKARRKTVKTA